MLVRCYFLVNCMMSFTVIQKEQHNVVPIELPPRIAWFTKLLDNGASLQVILNSTNGTISVIYKEP